MPTAPASPLVALDANVVMDFDAYEYGIMSLSEVLNNPVQSMGRGFVLAMLLTNDAVLRECELR
jgi:hypothetical protein